ncbi:siderophore biosynthesis protein-like protein [Xylona heveae TC161]|uniref:Siderophore biosynthesis protein-like protein n=1 Tax=Xylona heveae (strain CBS 132557 / TC161) TaxID=1328760 RepID=A0A164ZKA4_XYLHT|nr:siderophore biosynthesis protein-like protein [Xylona heveae TC161]KZF19199.1 siderophore biosynthesis protein-like protein [Xylona heveae TC161]
MHDIVHLPNGHTLTVTPVFGGFFFRANALKTHHSVFPPGWTLNLSTEAESTEGEAAGANGAADDKQNHRFTKPTLRNDSIFISSISSPSSRDFRPATSPTREIAMMLWASLYWYFHQPEPDTHMTTSTSAKTPGAGKPKGDWRVQVKRQGILKGRNLLQKLERMGLVSSEDTSVGVELDEKHSEAWNDMFTSRRTFWQLDPRIFLFTLPPRGPAPSSSPFSSSGTVTPASEQPTSPTAQGGQISRADLHAERVSQGLWSPWPPGPGPFASGSHLPTYYPPPPLQFTFSNGVQHPVRPKPPRQGETFYTRYVPSLGQCLSFRVASLPAKGAKPFHCGGTGGVPDADASNNGSTIGTQANPYISTPTGPVSDVDLLHKWMNDPRVAHFWGEQGPIEHQEEFLRNNLKSRHSFPVIGCWDGKPFGYFEIYWVKEDRLGRYLGDGADYWDRGFHCLIGENEFRGPHRVQVWLSALVHHCLVADQRTQTVMLEPRVDNQK